MTKAIGIILFISLFVVLQATAQKRKSAYNAQAYSTALGVKFYPGAISLKHFVKSDAALEALGYFWDKAFRITGLYEIHGDVNGAPGLKWYVGPGMHAGFYNTKYGGGTSVGVDGVLGLDYKIKAAPLNLSIDWQPSFEFGNKYGNGFSGNWGGFAIRYVF